METLDDEFVVRQIGTLAWAAAVKHMQMNFAESERLFAESRSYEAETLRRLQLLKPFEDCE